MVVNVLNYEIGGNEFEIHWNYYVNFLTNTLEEGMNSLILSPAVC